MSIASKLGTKIANVADDVVGAAIAHLIFTEKDGKKVVKKEAVQAIAPIFAQDKADEGRFSALMDKLPDSAEKALEEYFLSQLGENQRADFVLCVAQMSVESEQSAINFLQRMADEPDMERMKRIALSRRFIKEKESDYPIKKFKILQDIAFKDAQQLRDWLLRQDPANPGFRDLLNKIAAEIEAKSKAVGGALKATAIATGRGIKTAAKATGRGIKTAAKAVDSGLDNHVAPGLERTASRINTAANRINCQRRNRGFLKRLFGI